MDFLISLMSNILANFLFWLGLGLFVYVVLRFAQSSFLDFFGVRESRQLSVYLSNLWQSTPENLAGSVLSGYEFPVIRTIAGLFGEAPFRLPEVVKGLVDTFFLGERVSVSLKVSPLLREQIAFSSMIVVGGTPKNSVRRYYFASGLVYLAIAGESAEPPADIFSRALAPRVLVMKGPQKGREITGEFNYAIVEKVHDEEHQAVVIMCAGFRGDSSWAATEYLVHNWRGLAREYKNRDFALCLGFPKSEQYMESYTEPTVIARFSV